MRTRVLINFFPHVNSDVYVERLGPAPLLTFSGAPHDEMRLLVKRVIDVAVAGTARTFESARQIRATTRFDKGGGIFRQASSSKSAARQKHVSSRSLG